MTTSATSAVHTRTLARMRASVVALRHPRADDDVLYGRPPIRWTAAGREGVPTRGEMRRLLADDTERAADALEKGTIR